MSNSTVKEIESLIKSSTETLRKALGNYWPVINPDKNGIQEANLTYHLAHACMKKGLNCYPEASHAINHEGNKRVDLLVNGKLNNKVCTFLVESKKLYSSEQALKMFDDFNKMSQFIPVNSDISAPKYAVLLAVTVSDENAEWWTTPYKSDGKGWTELMESLEKCEMHDNILIETQYKQHIVYAIAKIPSS